MDSGDPLCLRKIESTTIAVYVHQLRRKLGEGLIATVHGFGYRIGEEGRA